MNFSQREKFRLTTLYNLQIILVKRTGQVLIQIDFFL